MRRSFRRPAMATSRVLVVGTTSDYVQHIHAARPGRALFLTDSAHRAAAVEPAPDAASEVLAELCDHRAATAAVHEHLARHDQRLNGIACYDCESLPLAAELAQCFGLRFASPQAVAACRNKHESKLRWREAGVPCPSARLVTDLEDVTSFRAATGPWTVMKPLTGSGSELVFLCRSEAECADALHALRVGLASHPNARMYPDCEGGIHARRVFGAEEYIEGPEMSCDFAIRGGQVRIWRVAQKIKARQTAFGTTAGYEVPAPAPHGLAQRLGEAAAALGLDNCVAMADYILCEQRPVLLEMAPRVGGDCLPDVIRASSGLDTLTAALDFAAGEEPHVPHGRRWSRCLGVRFFAPAAGRVRRLDASPVLAETSVVACVLKRRVGEVVQVPPADYDSWILGHAVLRLERHDDAELTCLRIASLLQLEVAPE